MLIKKFTTAITPDETGVEVQKEIQFGSESISFCVRIPNRNYALSELEIVALKRAQWIIGQLIETVDQAPKAPPV